MNFYLINYFEWVIAMVLQSVIIVFSLPCKKKLGRISQIAILAGMQLVPLTLKYLFNDNMALRNGMLLLTTAAVLAYQILFQEGKVYKKILFLFLIMVMNFLGEFVASMLLADQLAGIQLTMDMPIVFVYLVYQFIFANIFMLLLLLIWSRILKMARFDARLMICAFVFPISQVLLLLSINTAVYDDGSGATNQWIVAAGLVMSLLADVYLMYMLLQEQQKKEMEKRLSEIEMQRALSQQHYEEIESRREEFAKIRHDINNQLSAIGSLVEAGNDEKAKEMIASLGGFVASTAEYQYCADPIVNAVLTENSRLCEEMGIRFDCDILIASPLKIDPVKVCSIFSNLLRNALAAAKRVKVDKSEAEAFVEVYSEICGEYLNVKVRNADLPQEGKKRKRTDRDRKHYGILILKQIAEEYNGFYEVKEEDRVYECFVSVENRA